jgi:hypothetical protein
MVAVLPPILAFLYERAQVLSSSLPALFPFVDNPLVGAGFWQGRFTALAVMGRYLKLLVWPARLSSDYSYGQIPLATGTVWEWAACVAISALGVLLVLQFRRQPVLFFGGLFAFGAFLPTSNLLFPIGTIMAERLLYLPAFGLILCLMSGVWRLAEGTRARHLVVACMIVAMAGLAVRTRARNPDWESNVTLSQAAVRSSPGSYKAHLQVADALFRLEPEHRNLGKIMEEAERGLSIIDPLPDKLNEWTAYKQVAEYYRIKRQYAKEAELLSREVAILEAAPPLRVPQGKTVVLVSLADANRTLAQAYIHIPDAAKAYAPALRALNLVPGSPQMWRTVVEAQRAAGRSQEAVVTLMTGQILTHDPSLADDMVNIYRGLPEPGCALVLTGAGAQPNPSCPRVHKDICDAEVRAQGILMAQHQPDRASRLMSEAQSRYGCAADPLHPALPLQ